MPGKGRGEGGRVPLPAPLATAGKLMYAPCPLHCSLVLPMQSIYRDSKSPHVHFVHTYRLDKTGSGSTTASEVHSHTFLTLRPLPCSKWSQSNQLSITMNSIHVCF